MKALVVFEGIGGFHAGETETVREVTIFSTGKGALHEIAAIGVELEWEDARCQVEDGAVVDVDVIIVTVVEPRVGKDAAWHDCNQNATIVGVNKASVASMLRAMELDMPAHDVGNLPNEVIVVDVQEMDLVLHKITSSDRWRTYKY